MRPMITLTSLILCFALIGNARRHFKTEPELHTTKVIVRKTSPNLEPGYIFVAPLGRIPGDQLLSSHGTEIFDTNGDLVWVQPPRDLRPMRSHVCNNLGKPVICWHEITTARRGYSEGLNYFVDETYTDVAEFGQFGDLIRPDLHEINTPGDGQTLLQDVFQIRRTDLTRFGATDKSFAADACFQELDLNNRELLFQWCSFDHIPLWDMYAPLNTSVNWTDTKQHPPDGWETYHRPWDPFHINGIDKNSEGDYLISLRNADMLLKIAGNNNTRGLEPGEVMWKLRGGEHGEKGDFSQDFLFAGQHAGRFVNISSTSEVITFFNNQYKGKTSQGVLVELRNDTMEARLLQAFTAPDQWWTWICGSMQYFPQSGHAFLGWGRVNPTSGFSEYGPDGTLLYHATIERDDMGFLYSAQAWKFPWTGRPLTKPKLLAYAKSCRSPFVVHVSWNGATEVVEWEFFVASSSEGPWTSAGIVRRSGFETSVRLAETPTLYARVDARAKNGSVLGSSEPAKTYIPRSFWTHTCRLWGCEAGYQYHKQDSIPCDGSFQTLGFGTVGLDALFVFIIYELLALNWQWVFFTVVHISPKHGTLPLRYTGWG